MRTATLLVLLVLAACSTSNAGTDAGTDAEPDADTRPPTPPEWDRAIVRPNDAQARADRAACKFGPGALAGETLGPSTPIEKDLPLDTIVVLMMENHSFDNYLAKLGEYTQRSDIEVAPPNASNPDTLDAGPDAAASAVPFQHAPHKCTADTNHSWSGSHLEWNEGKMDGFVVANEQGTLLGKGERALTYLDHTDLPFYYALFGTFAIGDHYYCSVLGPTWPNRMYLYSATSFGRTTNDLPDTSSYPFPQKDASILDELEKRHVSWGLYGTSGALIVHGGAVLNRWGRRVTHFESDFFVDAKAGALPQVVFLDTTATTAAALNPNEHPPAQVQVGQKWVSDVVHALFLSPQWNKLALFFTYDEHGGYYDHVPPPAACKPDAHEPVDKNGAPVGGAFDRYGMRVPFAVVSPFARKGFVSHNTYDHASIVRFIQAKFRVPALTARDANADIPVDMFDFASPPFAMPPALAEPPIDQADIEYCSQNFP